MTVNKLHGPLQLAYRASSSTEIGTESLMIDEKKAVILIILDLSAAFDTVDHNLLLSRVMMRLGIGRTVLTWRLKST